MRLRIVADENIPLARETFGLFGDVELLPGRAIAAPAVARADVLIVRSVTKVGEQLLTDSPVRFVGTATIGTDHVDQAYLARRGVAFAAAPGCNARSVAEYLVAALLELEADLGRAWPGAVLGVVGAGSVGSHVATLARLLGFTVLECDPPRAAREPGFRSQPLGELLARADVITAHVPLERAGEHPTRHLLGAAALDRLRDGTVVINTSRGGVVEDEALRAACAAGRLHAVLDVFETEPDPSPALIDVLHLASPHVAGYSLDGKLAGTRMVAEALARFLGSTAAVDPRPFSPPVPAAPIETDAEGREAVRDAVRAVYAIRADDDRLRTALAAAGEARGPAFDRLRRDYPVRRELAGHRVAAPRAGAAARQLLADLGFSLVG